jgi:very-short-patch-repair endonuclease
MGVPHTEEWKQSNRLRHLGRKRSPETCQKISEAKRGKKLPPCSLETREKLSRSLKGRKQSEEHRRRNSLAQKAKYITRPELKKAPQTPEARRKRVDSLKKTRTSEWWKQFHSKQRDNPKVIAALVKGRDFWKTPSHRRTRLLKKFWEAGVQARAALGTGESSLERIIHAQLGSRSIWYEKHVIFSPYIVDIYLPEFHLAIECDGEYWHGSTDAQKYDRRRDRCLLSRYGLQVVRLPGTAIQSIAGELVDRILKEAKKKWHRD